MGEPVRFGFVGPSYQSQAVTADNQACINLYLEQDESGAGNAPVVLYSTPGTKTFAALIAGVAPTFPDVPTVDKAVTTGGDGTGTVVSVAATPVTTNEWAFLAYNLLNSSLNTPTPGSWTALTATGLTNAYYLQLAAATAINPTVSVGASNTWAALLALFTTVSGAAAVVQTRGVDCSAVPSTALAFTGNVTKGNTLICYVSGRQAAGHVVPSPAVMMDTQGNVYDNLGTGYHTSSLMFGHSQQVTMFACIAKATGACTVTVSGMDSSFDSATLQLVEVSGLQPFTVQAPATPTRGSISITGRTFMVAGSGFFELFANGTFTQWGTVGNDARPVTMAASPQQLLLASAGTAYVFDLSANTLTPIPGTTFPGAVAQAGICDDFFIITVAATKEFFVSAPLDAMDWVTNGGAIVSVFPDNIVGFIVSHRQIVFGSDTKTVFYYDSGNIFPFDVIPGSDMDQGLAAEFSYALLNNTFLWLGSDERGRGKVWTASGYTPVRVSNHAIEFAIQGYSRIDDAVAFTYQDQGHDFYCLYFPTPSVLWVLDTITGMWHQQAFEVATTGLFQAAHRWNHTFNFGLHLVGDWQSNHVYSLHIPVQTGGVWTYADDDGIPIVRVRRAPHISKSQRRQYFNELEVFVEVGLGPIPPLLDPAGNPRGPIISMRFSNDSGRTWSNWSDRDCGQSGAYKRRVRWLRLGQARDRIFEVRMSDPVAWRIVDAYLDYDEGDN